ncbi:MAG: SRPBCC domain-containing protein [Chloroflexi bacterium]|nr:SRPBCC domain-containing protein [Chloroflexota bacterium]
MPESIKVSAVIPASPRRIYEAWLGSAEHTAMSGGGAAQVDPRVGGAFSAWDGYIQGTTQALAPYSRIVQSWRSADFPEGAADSTLEVLLAETPKGTRVTLAHTNIPDGQGDDYKQGWKDYYFTPMKWYFGAKKG